MDRKSAKAEIIFLSLCSFFVSVHISQRKCVHSLSCPALSIMSHPSLTGERAQAVGIAGRDVTISHEYLFWGIPCEPRIFSGGLGHKEIEMSCVTAAQEIKINCTTLSYRFVLAISERKAIKKFMIDSFDNRAEVEEEAISIPQSSSQEESSILRHEITFKHFAQDALRRQGARGRGRRTMKNLLESF